MSRFQICITTMVVLAVSIVLTGCGESVQSPQFGSAPPYSVTIEQLASRLGLTVQNGGNPYFELSNANNRVLLFTYKGGRVYVNGKTVAPIGTTSEVNGKTYVSELLVPKIRGYLKTGQTFTPPTPSGNNNLTLSGTVVIDPGHGGKDPGGQSILGYWEKTVNLPIAEKIANYLRQSGIRVIMTREGDTYPELEERAALANRINADRFVSIHCDSNDSSGHKGFTVYIARQSSSTSKKMGRTLERTLSNAGIPSKGLRNADYKVLVQTRCPAVLIECGYMSNYDEAELLQNGWYQDKLARAIADGIKQSL